MWIQIYLEQSEKFSFQLIDSKLKKILSNSKDIDCKLIKNTFDRVEYICAYKDMEIKAYARDFSANGVNRGDLAVSTAIYTRDNPCSAIFNQVVINHKAEILPCCHIRTDYEKHKSFALGSLENNNIFDIFKDKQYLNWRKNLLSFDKRFEYPCTNCNYKIVKKTTLLANHIDSLIK
jgi:radical SAM protein with 4Fe4S-binding SPASM domain